VRAYKLGVFANTLWREVLAPSIIILGMVLLIFVSPFIVLHNVLMGKPCYGDEEE